MELSQMAPSQDLLAYYRKRVENFDKEREELLKRVESCGAERSEVHRLEWENRKRSEEVRELQQALSNAHAYLFEERERLLALQAENDNLRLQEMEDRRQIKHLLALTQPTQQEITYHPHSKPRAVTAFPHGPGPDAGSHGGTGAKGGRLMRTVFLPTVNTDSLLLRLEALEAQLADQKKFAEERVAALMEDRRIRQEDFEASQGAASRKLDAMATSLKKAEDRLQHTTHDLILAQRDMQAAEDKAASFADELKLERKKAKEEIADLKREAAKDMALTRAAADQRIEEFSETLRAQIRQRELELADLQCQHRELKETLEDKVRNLTSRLAKAMEANKQLDLRRAMDMEGWSNDVGLLRKRLAAAERKLKEMKLIERLPDDERLDALLEGLQKKAPEPDRLGHGAPRDASRLPFMGIPSLLCVAAEIHGAKGGIAALEGRIQAQTRRTPP
eukprot:jgi/Botrbrau1/18238/Bobra.53_1s0092.1